METTLMTTPVFISAPFRKTTSNYGPILLSHCATGTPIPELQAVTKHNHIQVIKLFLNQAGQLMRNTSVIKRMHLFSAQSSMATAVQDF